MYFVGLFNCAVTVLVEFESLVNIQCHNVVDYVPFSETYLTINNIMKGLPLAVPKSITSG